MKSFKDTTTQAKFLAFFILDFVLLLLLFRAVGVNSGSFLIDRETRKDYEYIYAPYIMGNHRTRYATFSAYVVFSVL